MFNYNVNQDITQTQTKVIQHINPSYFITDRIREQYYSFSLFLLTTGMLDEGFSYSTAPPRNLKGFNVSSMLKDPSARDLFPDIGSLKQVLILKGKYFFCLILPTIVQTDNCTVFCKSDRPRC